MKKLIYAIVILTLLTSCKKQVDKTVQETQQSEKINPITDPDLFIGKHKAEAAILGVFHFDNPGQDSYKKKYPYEILSEKRQIELNNLVNDLAQYNPTKILIEVARKEADSIYNVRYTKFLNGEFDISNERDERYQIAFRLAKKLGHKKIYAADARATKWFGVDIDWDNYDEDEYLKSLGQYEKTQRYDYDKMYEFKDSLKTTTTLNEHLRFLNNPGNSLKSHQAYLTVNALIGAGDLYIGADGLARWYQRNFKIFANAYDITDFSKKEKILLIYGSGHVWQLRQLLTDSPDFEYIEINNYLKE